MIRINLAGLCPLISNYRRTNVAPVPTNQDEISTVAMFLKNVKE
jgi:hypothetical protein